MTEHQRDELLLDMRDRLERIERDHGAALRENGAILHENGAILREHGAILREHGAALHEHGAKLDTLLTIVQGQATTRIATDERLAALERRVTDLERQAG